MEVMFEEVKRLKIGLSNAEVCCGRAGKPYWITHNVFLAFILPLFNYVSELEFDSTPNYQRMIRILEDHIDAQNIKNDGILDWTSIPSETETQDNSLHFQGISIEPINSRKRESTPTP